MERTLDMTSGTPWKLVLKFSFPLILANIGQQLYMIVDASIVGRGLGVDALAAVGSTDWTYWLILWTVLSLTQGFSVFISRSFGDKKYDDMNKIIAMSSFLSMIIGIVLTVAGLIAVRPLLEALKTPSDIIDGASIYLYTMISGTLVVTAYNMASSVLRALGDGKSPLVAMGIAAILNIGLDLLFVFVFKWGIFGAAFASVLSQLVSFFYCFYQIKKIKCIKLDKNSLKLDFKIIRKLFIFGFPLALEHMVISLGGIILQSTINVQGSVFVAGYTAVNKLYGLLECTAISLGAAFMTFLAQNFGAGKRERVQKGFITGVKFSVIASLVVSIIVFMAGKYMLLAFLDISNEGGMEALTIAWRYLYYMAIFMSVLYLIHIYRNALQALGVSVWSMISGIMEFFVRVFMGKVIIEFAGTVTLYYIEPAAWLGALILVMIPYHLLEKKLLQQIIQ